MIVLLSGLLHASHYDVMVVGDEISAYYKSPTNWVTLLKKQNACPIQIYNSSKTGATSEDGYHALESFLKRNKSKVVVIEIGYNDVATKHKFSEVEKNIDGMITLLKDYDTKIILVGIELPPHFNTIYRQLFKSTYQRLAHKHDIELITTGYTADPNMVELDQIQPNTEGHQSIRNSISPLIEELTCK
jgi:acyl-CoA thioesterase-1